MRVPGIRPLGSSQLLMRVRVCALNDLPPGAATTVGSGALEVAVFNVDGELFALDNACAHTGGPIVDGLVRDGTVTCPLHWWRYDLRTGGRRGAEHIRQATYPVTVANDAIFVDVLEPEPVLRMRERLLRHAEEWNAGKGGER